MNIGDSVTLNARQRQRLRVVSEVQAGRWSVEQAAEVLGLSSRQVWRLKRAYQDTGVEALLHGNRGRASLCRLGDDLRAHVVELARGKYAGCNDSHLTELLALDEEIVLSRPTLRRVLRAAGIASVRKRRAPRHRQRRDRQPRSGMLLQVDGSPHHWFGADLPRCTLLAAIDDATSAVVAAVFRDQEDAAGYLLLLQQVLQQHGVPLAWYHDRHGIFLRSSKEPWSIQEELAGRQELTQVGRALEQLGITSIAARSPQAKGRVERLWGTLQDRLVAELRLAAITTMDQAQRFLPAFLQRHNARFAVAADEPGLAYAAPDPTLDLERVFSFQYPRVVANDNTVRFAGERFQLPPGPGRRSYAHAHVLIHELLDGRRGVWFEGRWLLRLPAPDQATPLRVRKTTRARQPRLPLVPSLLSRAVPPTRKPTGEPTVRGLSKPAPDHPWRRGFGARPKPATPAPNETTPEPSAPDDEARPTTESLTS